MRNASRASHPVKLRSKQRGIRLPEAGDLAGRERAHPVRASEYLDAQVFEIRAIGGIIVVVLWPELDHMAKGHQLLHRLQHRARPSIAIALRDVVVDHEHQLSTARAITRAFDGPVAIRITARARMMVPTPIDTARGGTRRRPPNACAFPRRVRGSKRTTWVSAASVAPGSLNPT